MEKIVFSAMAGAISGFILGMAINLLLFARDPLNWPMTITMDESGIIIMMVFMLIGVLVGFTYGMLATNKKVVEGR